MTGFDVPRETQGRLEALASLILAENERQNLVAASTVPNLWQRHIEDSLQLLALAPQGRWLDIGSGGGLPGLVIACARRGAITLVEPRRLRAAFLERAVVELGLMEHVTVIAQAVERLDPDPYAVISARAVASLTKLFAMAEHLADASTTWLLMKGAKARDELEEAGGSWQGDFRLVPSTTDPAAAIVVAHSVRRRGRR